MICCRYYHRDSVTYLYLLATPHKDSCLLLAYPPQSSWGFWRTRLVPAPSTKHHRLEVASQHPSQLIRIGTLVRNLCDRGVVSCRLNSRDYQAEWSFVATDIVGTAKIQVRFCGLAPSKSELVLIREKVRQGVICQLSLSENDPVLPCASCAALLKIPRNSQFAFLSLTCTIYGPRLRASSASNSWYDSSLRSPSFAGHPIRCNQRGRGIHVDSLHLNAESLCHENIDILSSFDPVEPFRLNHGRHWSRKFHVFLRQNGGRLHYPPIKPRVGGRTTDCPS